MNSCVVGIDELRKRLRSYGAAHVDLLESAAPILESGRVFDLEHTLDVVRILLDFLDEHPEAATRHDVLIPAAIFHDSGWSVVPKGELPGSYGNVRSDNTGKIFHQQRGAAIAREILLRHGWAPETIGSVAAIISIHDVPKEYVKDQDALLIAEIDKLVRYMPSLFWALVEDGAMTLEQRVRFLEAGIEEWFRTPEFAERARRLLEERKRERANGSGDQAQSERPGNA